MLQRLLKRLFVARSASRDREASAGASSMPAASEMFSSAVARFEAGDFDGSRAAAEEVVRRDPRHDAGWNLLGALAVVMEQNELAVRQFERAIELQPHNAEYLSNCGEACRRAGWMDDAVDHCRAALEADPRHFGAHYNLSLALIATCEIEQARMALTRALEIQPDARRARSALLFLLLHHPDADGPTLLAEHRAWNDRHAVAFTSRPARPRVDSSAGRRLRVGYVSADFRRHSSSYFLAPLFEHHDRDRFEVYCYSNTKKADDVTAQLRGYVSGWRDIVSLPDEDAASMIEHDRIDLLIDLSGHTADSRLLVFARKAAPVQLSYVGYPGTTGLSAMDYRVTDSHMDPPGTSEAFYVEKLLRLPHSIWCYRPPTPTPDVNELPALARGTVTFGSFHASAKVNNRVIELWARLLTRVPDAELLMAGVPAGETHNRLRERFAAHGVAESRIHIVGKTNFDDYWRLYHRIDIGLDSFPYNGGTTTCESLWMGVPVITLAGAFGVARAGASLLTSAGLAELVAASPEDYLDIAVRLAGDTDRLCRMRSGLRDRLRQSPLMDEAGFTRAFEKALCDAYDAAGTGTPEIPNDT